MTPQPASFAPADPGGDVDTGPAVGAQVQPSTALRESPADAWWTGPMLAAAAGSLPPGHFLVEPYFFDGHSAHANSYGSLSYLNYGLTDRVTVGLMPTFGYNQVKGGPSSSGLGLGDLTVLAQYRLTQFQPGHWTPTTSVVLEETLPTGRFDRLGDRPTNGVGQGAYTTTVGLYSQMLFWAPNGRILRMRLDLTQAVSEAVKLEDVSVYGTAAGFHGHAQPGDAFNIDLAGEYSLTQHWVLAMDAFYHHDGDTRVVGYDSLAPIGPTRLDLGASDTVGFAPAVEYNFTSRLGVLLGLRVVPAGFHTTSSVTPALAINYVH